MVLLLRIYHDARSTERPVYHDARSPERQIHTNLLFIHHLTITKTVSEKVY